MSSRTAISIAAPTPIIPKSGVIDYPVSPGLAAKFDEYGVKYRWLVLLATMLISVSVWLPATTINVALPHIMGAFGIDQNKAQWLSTGYLAANTATMLLTSWLLHAFGMRAAMVWGLSLFMAASLVGGIATHEDTVILARIVQGAAIGPLAPMTMVITFQIFPPERRGMAMGMFSMVMVLAPSLGPTVGGIITDAFSWRYIFFGMLPVIGLCIPLCIMFLPEREHTGPRAPFDWTGMIILSMCLTLLLVGLSNGQREGWNSDFILACLIGATLTCAAFIIWEIKAPHPMMDVRAFTYPTFVATSLVVFISSAGLYGVTYLAPLFLQTIQGVSASTAGILFVPAGLGMALIFPLSGYLSDRVPIRSLVMVGLILFALSAWWLNSLSVNTPHWWFVLLLLFGRVGLGLTMTPLSLASMGSLPPQLLSQASGLSSFMRQLGGALGVNLLSVELAQRTAFYHGNFMTAQNFGNAQTLEVFTRMRETYTMMGIPDVWQLPMTMGFVNYNVGIQAMTMGFRDGFLTLAIVFIICLIPTWFIRWQSPGAKAK